MPRASSGAFVDSVNVATVWFSFAVPRLWVPKMLSPYAVPAGNAHTSHFDEQIRTSRGRMLLQ